MIVAFVLSTMLAASGAPADQGGAAASPAPAAKPMKTDDKDRMVCRREEVTGSHRPEKICRTKHEWDVMTDEAHRMFREGGIQAVDRSTGQTTFGAPK